MINLTFLSSLPLNSVLKVNNIRLAIAIRLRIDFVKTLIQEYVRAAINNLITTYGTLTLKRCSGWIFTAYINACTYA